VKREIALFIAVTLFGLWVLQNLVITLASPAIANLLQTNDQSTLLVAKLAATVVSMVWNYFMYDRVVFKNKS
jgi:putative flippase GtrA